MLFKNSMGSMAESGLWGECLWTKKVQFAGCLPSNIQNIRFQITGSWKPVSMNGCERRFFLVWALQLAVTS
jgi:hypothetical protein